MSDKTIVRDLDEEDSLFPCDCSKFYGSVTAFCKEGNRGIGSKLLRAAPRCLEWVRPCEDHLYILKKFKLADKYIPPEVYVSGWLMCTGLQLGQYCMIAWQIMYWSAISHVFSKYLVIPGLVSIFLISGVVLLPVRQGKVCSLVAAGYLAMLAVCMFCASITVLFISFNDNGWLLLRVLISLVLVIGAFMNVHAARLSISLGVRRYNHRGYVCARVRQEKMVPQLIKTEHTVASARDHEFHVVCDDSDSDSSFEISEEISDDEHEIVEHYFP